MIDSFKELPDTVIVSLLSMTFIFSFWLGWRMHGLLLKLKFDREKKHIDTDHTKVQKGMKKIWDDERNSFAQEKEDLMHEIETLKRRLENYRRKIAGLGLLSFTGSKKRSDILYSLLLENEALEQLLNTQAQRMADQHNQHLQEKFMDIEKRQRLLSEIFDDSRIKDYVREVLSENDQKILVKKEDGEE